MGFFDSIKKTTVQVIEGFRKMMFNQNVKIEGRYVPREQTQEQTFNEVEGRYVPREQAQEQTFNEVEGRYVPREQAQEDVQEQKNVQEQKFNEVVEQELSDSTDEKVSCSEEKEYSLSEFRFEVQDVFSITGGRTVVTGRALSGAARVGNTVSQFRNGEFLRKVVIVDIEQFRKCIDTIKQGENAGLAVNGVTTEEIQRGDILTRTQLQRVK